MKTIPPTDEGRYRAAASGAIANGKVIVVNSNGTVSVIGGSIALTSENYIGFSSGGAVADGGPAIVDVAGTVNQDQSGLTSGQEYFVQADGTLGTSADDPSVSAGIALSATAILVKG